MKTTEDIESYILRMGVKYEEVKPGFWILGDGEKMAVSIAGPVVAFRMKVMDTPSGNREKLFETLLRLNTSDMVHGAFGLEDESVVMVDALQLETLDYGEFQAVVDEFNLAISRHYADLSKFRTAA